MPKEEAAADTSIASENNNLAAAENQNDLRNMLDDGNDDELMDLDF